MVAIDLVDLCGIDPAGGVVDQQPTGGQPDNAIGEAPGQLDLMKADDGGDTVLAADFSEKAQHADRGFRIQTGHRLVGEDDGRLLSQRSGDPDALLLAAAEPIGAHHGFCQQPHPVESGQRAVCLCTVRSPKPAQHSG